MRVKAAVFGDCAIFLTRGGMQKAFGQPMRSVEKLLDESVRSMPHLEGWMALGRVAQSSFH